MRLVNVDAKMLKKLMIAKHLKCNFLNRPISLNNYINCFLFSLGGWEMNVNVVAL